MGKKSKFGEAAPIRVTGRDSSEAIVIAALMAENMTPPEVLRATIQAAREAEKLAAKYQSREDGRLAYDGEEEREKQSLYESVADELKDEGKLFDEDNVPRQPRAFARLVATRFKSKYEESKPEYCIKGATMYKRLKPWWKRNKAVAPPD